MDVNMPRMDGIEAMQRIKQEYPGIVAIGLSIDNSGDNSGTMEEAVRAAGSAAFISKDAAAEQLHQAIEAAVRRPGRSRTPAS